MMQFILSSRLFVSTCLMSYIQTSVGLKIKLIQQMNKLLDRPVKSQKNLHVI